MRRQTSIVAGLLLIAFGLFFLLLQAFPGIGAQFDLTLYWPLLIVGIGGLFLLGSLAGTPPLAVPGSILSGIGLLLLYQNATGNWESWAYAWALIPGFVGLGIVLMNRLDRGLGNGAAGWRLMGISLVLFVIFGGFFGAFGPFWPLILIAAGGFLMLRGRQRQTATAKNDLNELGAAAATFEKADRNE